MNRAAIGVIGHVDHGKTALVRALTGIDTDRLPEEKQRGISIALGFAHFRPAPDTEIDLIDMPGHERFVRTMVAGATGIDAVVLVVAANEGVAPQTVEHIDIAALLGIRQAVVAVSKCELVAPEEAQMVAEDAMRLLAASGMQAPAPVMTSAASGLGIGDLRRSLAAVATDRQARTGDGIVFLPIDRTFSLPGHGPVVTGTLRGASLAERDRLELFPPARSVRLRSLQVHGARVATALPGQRVALNLRDVEVGELQRGMALAAPGALQPADRLTIALRTVAGAPVLGNGKRLRALFGTQDVAVRLRLLDRDEIAPGETGYAQLRCDDPVVLPAGEHVILRLASPARTVAGGKLLEAGTARLKRHDGAVLARLELLDRGSPAEIVTAEVERGAMSLQQLARLTGLSSSRLATLLEALPVAIARPDLVVPLARLNLAVDQVAALLALHPEGLSQERLAAAMSAIEAPVLQLALTRLLEREEICKRESRYAISRPEEEALRVREEAELAGRIAATLRRGGLTPPRPAEIVTDAVSRRAVDRLIREGAVVRAVDRAKHKEILFHQDAIDEARRRLVPLLDQGPGLLVTEICAALGISRKFAMPLLDHLDTIRFTRRIGDRRLRHVVAPVPR